MVTFILIIIAIIITVVNNKLYKKSEALTGLEIKNYIFLGMLVGFEIGVIFALLFGSFLPIVIFMLLGELIGKFLSYPENADNRYMLYKKRRLKLIITFIIMLPMMVAAVFLKLTPNMDNISTKELPASYIIVNEQNYVASQSGSDCSGYSTAYVLRHLGYSAEGASIYKQMPTFFGRVALHNVQHTLKGYNVKPKSYHGNIDTLKAELTKGVPVIALITITFGSKKGLHYVAVIGYDEEYIYMADSTRPNANIFDKKYCNRKVTYDEFRKLWKTDIYPVNNLYIVSY